MKDELMRRISRAIDTEGGVASDADLAAELRKNPEAAKYAKDLSRLDVWLGSWPLPEPDAAAMEALASRIEQRLDDKLAAIMDPTLPPDFDDDDSLRDATAGLLQSGEHTVASGEYTLESGSARTSQPEIVSDSQLEVVSMPMLELVSSPQLEVVRDSDAPAGVSHEAPAAVSHEAPAAVSHEAPAAVSHEAPAAVSHEAPAAGPAPEPEGPSTLAKVQLKKREVRGALEEHAAESSGEPLSAADLQVRLAADAPKKKKTKKKATDAEPAAAKVLPLKELAGKKDERISIPTPAARMGQGTLAPVKELPKEKERSGGGAMWWMAAAAAVGLGIFGASSLLSTGSAPSASPQQTITAAAATAPMAAREEPPPPPIAPAEAPADVVAPMTAAPMAAPTPVMPPMAPPPATIVAPAPTTGFAVPVARPRVAPAYDGLAESDAPARRAAPRIAMGPSASASGASGSSASGGGRGALLMDEGSGGGGAVAHSRASASPSTPTTTTPPVSQAPTAPAPPPAAAAEAASLPDTPDRDAIQQALGAVTPAVQACAAGDHGVADVDIVIASTGRVTTATVNGRFAGTPVGSCIARAVRGARFPRFAQPRYEVTYPFHL